MHVGQTNFLLPATYHVLRGNISQYDIYGGNRMGITNSNKQIDVTQIDCSGTLKVTLALSAAPDIASNSSSTVSA